MSASVVTSTKVSDATSFLAFPGDFIASLQHQVVQQGDVIKDLRRQIKQWMAEVAEWTRQREDMRQLVDFQKAECTRLRGEVLRAMTRAEKAEEGYSRMAETAKKATERESAIVKERVERETKLRRELQVASETEVALRSAVEKAKEAVKVVQSDLVQLKETVERDVIVMKSNREETQRLQSKVVMLEMQVKRADEVYTASLGEVMKRIKEVEDEKINWLKEAEGEKLYRIKEVEGEKMKLYGELQVVKAESSELKRMNQALENKFSKKCDKVRSSLQYVELYAESRVGRG